MLNKHQAREIALQHIGHQCNLANDEIVIVDALTLEKEYGWIFFYDSKRFLEKNDVHCMLVGNGPVVVRKKDGVVHQLGTALSTEEEIDKYERNMMNAI